MQGDRKDHFHRDDLILTGDLGVLGHSIVLVQAAALNDRGSLEADGPVFAAADTIGCGEGNFVLVTRGSNARYACKCAEAPVDMAVVGILDGGQWGLS